MYKQAQLAQELIESGIKALAVDPAAIRDAYRNKAGYVTTGSYSMSTCPHVSMLVNDCDRAAMFQSKAIGIDSACYIGFATPTKAAETATIETQKARKGW